MSFQAAAQTTRIAAPERLLDAFLCTASRWLCTVEDLTETPGVTRATAGLYRTASAMILTWMHR